MTKILYTGAGYPWHLPDVVRKRYCAFKGILEKDFKYNREDQDLIHFIEEYKKLHPEDENASKIGIEDIGNASRYMVIDHYGWEYIYTEKEIPWRTVGVIDDNDNWDLTIRIYD